MSTKLIKNDVYSVGVLNPNLRVFDIIMKTDYGTSYNSFLVKGEDEYALIETTHHTFFDIYLNNLTEVCDITKIKYIILNHNEPDHTGALALLMEKMPNAQIVTSQAGSIYLKKITNKLDTNIKVVKDNDELIVGGRKLKFINAPFLHWPDSMFTYLEDTKTLFSCDFFGSHYCEPEIYDYNITYQDKYKTAFKGYYDAIFGPFKPYVLKGLEKIKGLDLDFICTSHGPVLTKENSIEKAIEDYSKWSIPVVQDEKNIPIFYCSAYGNTQRMAEAIKEGILEVISDASVEVFNVIEQDMAELAGKLNSSYAFLIGSPTINKDALSPIWQLLSHIEAINIQKRSVAVFGSFGWSGEAIPMLCERLKALKLNVFNEGFKINFVPSDEEIIKAKSFGAEFAKGL